MANRVLPYLRAAFLLAVLGFAWLGLRGRGDEIADALRETSPGGVLAALVVVVLGLVATAAVWLRLMARLGATLPVTDGAATFFVGQLGKYIPGTVWSLGAQAQMAGRHAVPARATVTAGLVFLGYHLATGVAIGSGAALLGALDVPWPWWLSALALVGAVAGLGPAVVSWVSSRVAGEPVPISAKDTAVVLALMSAAWSLYAVSLVLLSPGLPWHDIVALGGAFALAYAVGVVVVFAPAGVGAREALFIALVAPMTDVAAATALALLARVVHTAADGTVAAVSYGVARRQRILKG